MIFWLRRFVRIWGFRWFLYDGATPNWEIIKYGQVENFTTSPTIFAAQDRYSVTKTETIHLPAFMCTVFLTNPVGNGVRWSLRMAMETALPNSG